MDWKRWSELRGERQQSERTRLFRESLERRGIAGEALRRRIYNFEKRGIEDQIYALDMSEKFMEPKS